MRAAALPRTVGMCFKGCLALILLGCVLPASAGAHNLTRSFATWTFADSPDAAVRVLVQVSWTDVYRALPEFHPTRRAVADDDALASFVRERYGTTSGDGSCEAGQAAVVDRDRQSVRIAWTVTCSPGAVLQADVDAFFPEAPGHLVMAQVERSGMAPAMTVLTQRQSVWSLAAIEDAAGEGEGEVHATPIFPWFYSGMGHVLGGLDHVAFVLALLLLGGGFGVMVRIVTAFTIAHSLTLGATVLGWVHPHEAAVETWVGLSILLVAGEALWHRIPAARRPIVGGLVVLHGGLLAAWFSGHTLLPADLIVAGAILSILYLALAHRLPAGEARLGTAAAFLFGLVHGFAFAGALLGDGPVPGEPWRVLLGFNLGVEAGQVLVVVIAWPLLRLTGAYRSDLMTGTVGALLFIAALAFTAAHGLGLT